ncbi:GDSL-type esterase/lipase family protein [Nonomuraea fuscirosea]|uniref:GDSL-type esterase/lipase family protein n=1 Tax=Nonomuraea fuscirosea TaxID=1291556 RepID=UPI0033F50F4F
MTSNGHWVTTWTAMPQLTEPGNMPPPPYTKEDLVLADTTLRQTVRVSAGGPRFRLRLSNAFGGAPLPLTRVAVALPLDGASGVNGIRPGSSRPVTFSGRASAVVTMGAHVVSDPVAADLAPGSVLTVTVHLSEGQRSSALTSHPGSRTTSHLATGDHVDAAFLPAATAVDHWYLISGVEAWAGPGTATVVLLGDSLTDGRGSTTNGDDRWPDRLSARLGPDVAVANQAAGGNRVLDDGLGPSALARLDRDVLAQSGARRLVVFEGVNDLGTAEPTAAAQAGTAADLIAAFDQIVLRAHACGLLVYGPRSRPSAATTPTTTRSATGRRPVRRSTRGSARRGASTR